MTTFFMVVLTFLVLSVACLAADKYNHGKIHRSMEIDLRRLNSSVSMLEYRMHEAEKTAASLARERKHLHAAPYKKAKKKNAPRRRRRRRREKCR